MIDRKCIYNLLSSEYSYIIWSHLNMWLRACYKYPCRILSMVLYLNKDLFKKKKKNQHHHHWLIPSCPYYDPYRRATVDRWASTTFGSATRPVLMSLSWGGCPSRWTLERLWLWSAAAVAARAPPYSWWSASMTLTQGLWWVGQSNLL